MFGAHTTPPPESPEPIDPGSNTPRVAIIALALLLVVGGGFFALRSISGDDAATTIACEPTVLSVTVAPAMADLLDDAVASLVDNGQCIELDVTTATVAEVAAAQADVDEGEENVFPDLWVPDSPAWQSVLAAADETGKILAPSLAATPVGLASGRSGNDPATWLDVLSSRQLVVSDPTGSGASALAMLAPFAEAAEGIGNAMGAQGAMTPVAQEFGAQVASGTVNDVTIDTIASGSPELIPVTERDFLIAQRGNDALEWVAPRTGVALLDFPLVQPGAGAGAMAMGSGQLDVPGRTGAKIAAWFTTDEGLAAIAGDKLRSSDGVWAAEGEGIGTGKQLPAPEQAQVAAVMKSWGVLTVPSSVLALIDVSASMDLSAGSTTRVALAVDAATTALDAFPDHARIGFRVFSIDQDGPGKDWKELGALRRLDAPTGDGRVHKELLREQADVIAGLTQGGTGLYDSTLAAYQAATREYNPNYYNAMVIITDGGNDDPGSISFETLIKELTKLHDPDRPVRIISIGISADADVVALGKIAEATNGQSFETKDPQGLLMALGSALLSR